MVDMLQKGPRGQPERSPGLSPKEKGEVYGRLLRSLFEREDSSAVKSKLILHYGCTRSMIDGVHAQLSKDLAHVTSHRLEPYLHGDPAGALRLVLRSFRMRGKDSIDEGLPGFGDFIRDMTGICERRGASYSWEYHVPRPRFVDDQEVGARTMAPEAAAHYNTPNKAAWRAEWEAFLTAELARMSFAERAKLRVICLPSRDPRLEIGIYLRLGIAPENIVAVERDSAAYAELRKNAMLLGGEFERVRYERVDVGKLPKELRGPYDIIAMDFHGCIAGNKMHSLAKIIPSDRCYAMVNLLTGREKDDTKDALAMHAAIMQNPFLLAVPAMDRKARLSGITHDHLDFRPAREEVAEDLLFWSIGSDHLARYSRQFAELHELYLKAKPTQTIVQTYRCCYNGLGVAADAVARILYALDNGIPESKLHLPAVAAGATRERMILETMGFRWAFRSPHAESEKKYEYRSEVSTNNQRFYSTFARLQFGMPETAVGATTCRFMSNVAFLLTRLAIPQILTALQSEAANPSFPDWRIRIVRGDEGKKLVDDRAPSFIFERRAEKGHWQVEPSAVLYLDTLRRELQLYRKEELELYDKKREHSDAIDRIQIQADEQSL